MIKKLKRFEFIHIHFIPQKSILRNRNNLPACIFLFLQFETWSTSCVLRYVLLNRISSFLRSGVENIFIIFYKLMCAPASLSYLTLYTALLVAQLKVVALSWCATWRRLSCRCAAARSSLCAHIKSSSGWESERHAHIQFACKRPFILHFNTHTGVKNMLPADGESLMKRCKLQLKSAELMRIITIAQKSHNLRHTQFFYTALTFNPEHTTVSVCFSHLGLSIAEKWHRLHQRRVFVIAGAGPQGEVCPLSHSAIGDVDFSFAQFVCGHLNLLLLSNPSKQRWMLIQIVTQQCHFFGE